jgi:hypothetical protein
MRPGLEQGFPALPPTTGGQNTHVPPTLDGDVHFRATEQLQWVGAAPAANVVTLVYEV